MHVLEFSSPMKNLSVEFGLVNTFRLGAAYAKILVPGELVGLIDRRKHFLFGTARVSEIHLLPLRTAAEIHAAKNHNRLGSDNAVAELLTAMRRRYGPHVATDEKITTVIYFEVL